MVRLERLSPRAAQLIAQYDATLGQKSCAGTATALAHEESYANFEARTAHATAAERTDAMIERLGSSLMCGVALYTPRAAADAAATSASSSDPPLQHPRESEKTKCMPSARPSSARRASTAPTRQHAAPRPASARGRVHGTEASRTARVSSRDAADDLETSTENTGHHRNDAHEWSAPWSARERGLPLHRRPPALAAAPPSPRFTSWPNRQHWPNPSPRAAPSPPRQPAPPPSPASWDRHSRANAGSSSGAAAIATSTQDEATNLSGHDLIISLERRSELQQLTTYARDFESQFKLQLMYARAHGATLKAFAGSHKTSGSSGRGVDTGVDTGADAGVDAGVYERVDERGPLRSPRHRPPPAPPPSSPRVPVDRSVSTATAWATETQFTRRILARVSTFSHLTESERTQVLSMCVEAKYSDGEAIVTQGEIGDLFYIVKAGQVDIVKNGKTLTTFAPADYFGERALLTNEPRAASCVARGPVTCVTLKRADFKSILNQTEDVRSGDLLSRARAAAGAAAGAAAAAATTTTPSTPGGDGTKATRAALLLRRSSLALASPRRGDRGRLDGLACRLAISSSLVPRAASRAKETYWTGMRKGKTLKQWAHEQYNPHPLRKEVPGATAVQRLQADLFDKRRFAYQRAAKNELNALGPDGATSSAYYGRDGDSSKSGATSHPDDPLRVARLRTSLIDVFRNRYVEGQSARDLEVALRAEPSTSPRSHMRSRETAPSASAQPRKEFRLKDSIWKRRAKWADSGSFYDDEAVYDRAFSLDWSRALRTHKLAKFILAIDDGEGDDSGDDEDLDGDGIVDSEIVEVGNALWKHHMLLYAIFDCFASIDAKKDISSVTYNAYKFFVQDCSLDVPGSNHCDSAHYDQLFIMINSTSAGGGRKGKSGSSQGTELELDHALVGRQGMAAGVGGINIDKRALCRHEWFNCLARMAIMRYVKTKEEADVSRAVERLLLQDVVPNVDDWVAADHQAFRREICYTYEVDAALREHKDSLLNIFAHFADSEGGANVGRAKKEKALMKLPEWIDMVKDLNLLDDHVTTRDATVAFVLSRMRVVDEEGGDSSQVKMENLSLEDFYEALCRMAVLMALPTDEEIEAAGAADAGDFRLRLQEMGRDDYDAWLAQWYAEHPAPMIKAVQPAHRCVTHLVMLIVRTIESSLQQAAVGVASAGADDLKISKKEMKHFGRRHSVA